MLAGGHADIKCGKMKHAGKFLHPDDGTDSRYLKKQLLASGAPLVENMFMCLIEKREGWTKKKMIVTTSGISICNPSSDKTKFYSFKDLPEIKRTVVPGHQHSVELEWKRDCVVADCKSEEAMEAFYAIVTNHNTRKSVGRKFLKNIEKSVAVYSVEGELTAVPIGFDWAGKGMEGELTKIKLDMQSSSSLSYSKATNSIPLLSLSAENNKTYSIPKGTLTFSTLLITSVIASSTHRTLWNSFWDRIRFVVLSR